MQTDMQNIMRRIAAPWSLWALPAVLFAVLWVFRDFNRPFWLYTSFDPDYYYLLNGLMMLDGHAPADVFHPGTPAQIVAALTLKLAAPFTANAQIIAQALDDPEAALAKITLVLMLTMALSCWWVGRIAYDSLGRPLPALLAQGAPFVSMIVLKYAVHAKPEPLLIVAVNLLAGELIRAARPDARPAAGDAARLGAAIAFGTACKITFAPLALAPLLVLRSFRLWAVYALAGIAAFLLFVAPALGQWEIYAPYLVKIVKGSGAYGEGPQTFIDVAKYPKSFFRLFASKLVFLPVLVLGGAGLAYYGLARRKNRVAPISAAWPLAGVCLAQIAQVALSAKQPSAHYIIPALLLTGAGLSLLYAFAAALPPFAARPAAYRRAWLLIALILAAAQTKSVWSQGAEMKERRDRALALTETPFARCAKVYYDTATSMTYAFHSADIMSGGHFQAELKKRRPADEYVYFLRYHGLDELRQWTGPLSMPGLFASYPCLVFRGTDADPMTGTAARLAGRRPDARCASDFETQLVYGADCRGNLLDPAQNPGKTAQ